MSFSRGTPPATDEVIPGTKLVRVWSDDADMIGRVSCETCGWESEAWYGGLDSAEILQSWIDHGSSHARRPDAIFIRCQVY